MVNAMLLNEFLKEHRKIEELEAVAAEQRKELQTVVSRLNEQALEIQKVSQQLQVNRRPASWITIGKSGTNSERNPV